MNAIFRKSIGITIHSPYALDECATRLAAAIDREGLLTTIRFIKPISSSKAVAGRINRHRIRLRMQHGTGHFIQHILVGRLSEEPNGTVLRGTFGIHVLVRIFIVIGCILGLTICGASSIGCLAGDVSRGQATVQVLMATFAMGCTVLAARVSRVNADQDLHSLADFLNVMLRAPEITVGAVSAVSRLPQAECWRTLSGSDPCG